MESGELNVHGELNAQSLTFCGLANPLATCEIQDKYSVGSHKFQNPSNGQHVIFSASDSRRGSTSRESWEFFDSQQSVSGVICKWVNYGKGWRPRWFVLRDAVLSYYKIDESRKISSTDTKHLDLKVIGKESLELMEKQKYSCWPGEACGKVHLQVSTIHKNSSNNKRFDIFTGTHIIHLRAETTEDRTAWLDALLSAKDKLQCTLSKPISCTPPSRRIVSSEHLRKRLSKEGLTEVATVECEAIMRTEFSFLLSRINVLQESHVNLTARLTQLEAETWKLKARKGRKGKVDANSKGGYEADTGGELGTHVGRVEVEPNEDDGIFFDANTFLGSDMSHSSASTSSELGEDSSDDTVNFFWEAIGLKYACFKKLSWSTIKEAWKLLYQLLIHLLCKIVLKAECPWIYLSTAMHG